MEASLTLGLKVRSTRGAHVPGSAQTDATPTSDRTKDGSMLTTFSSPPRPPGCTRNGFTLIELVVVLVIVGLLVGAVAPSLEAARNRSKNAVCHSRLRGIGLASGIYAEWSPDNLGIPVHPLQYCQCPGETCGSPCMEPLYIGAYEWGGKSGIGSPGHPFAIERNAPFEGPFAWMSSRYGTAAGFGPATRPMNSILYPSGFRDHVDLRTKWRADTTPELSKYRCPADDGPPRGAHCPDWVQHPGRTSFDHFGNSYAANKFMIASGSGGWMFSNSPFLRPASRVPNPARTINFEENIGRWAWACKNELAACRSNLGLEGVDPGPGKALRGWHGRNWTFNHLYVDGHTGVATIWIEGTEDAEGYAEHYFNELVYPNDPSLQEQYRCIIIRGDGWQKDTLPADLVETGLWHGGSGRPSYDGCVN